MSRSFRGLPPKREGLAGPQEEEWGSPGLQQPSLQLPGPKHQPGGKLSQRDDPQGPRPRGAPPRGQTMKCPPRWEDGPGEAGCTQPGGASPSPSAGPLLQQAGDGLYSAEAS